MPAKTSQLKITTPTTIVIFGATGDLSRRKLLPALFDLYRRGVLPTKFRIIGFSHRDIDTVAFRELVAAGLQRDTHRHAHRETTAFLKHCSYQRGDFSVFAEVKQLRAALADADKAFGVCANKLFHLAVAPHFYKPLLHNLAKSGLTIACAPRSPRSRFGVAGRSPALLGTKEGAATPDNTDAAGAQLSGWTRVLIEKPFGKDAASAQKLDAVLNKLFSEDQIFRIDHYLAKETIRNILTFRFSNALFEPLWNRDHIERVELEFYETSDVADRINFYDGVGALRDTGQNHLLQMLAFVAMEQPSDMEVDNIRAARAAVMRQLIPLRRRDAAAAVVRAQYAGYRREKGVQKNSRTETYFQIKVGLKGRRWSGVPFYLTMGKALSRDKVKIKVFFKPSAHCFGCPAGPHEHPQNFLVFRIQPQEGIAIHFWAKKPGFGMELVKKELTFDYAEFGGVAQDTPSPYETLIYRAMRGDQTNFASSEELKHSWKYITSILKLWKDVPLQVYKKGSGGPRHRLLG